MLEFVRGTSSNRCVGSDKPLPTVLSWNTLHKVDLSQVTMIGEELFEHACQQSSQSHQSLQQRIGVPYLKHPSGEISTSRLIQSVNNLANADEDILDERKF